MKKYTQNVHVALAIVFLAGLFDSQGTAQTFTNLHNFAYHTDGSQPAGGMALSGGVLYGAAEYAGTSNAGTLFKLNTNGSAFTNFYNFTNGTDGSNPDGTLLLSGNSLYGTAYYGGASTNGTIFRINLDGTGFTNIYSFTPINNSTNRDGANPYAGLILSGSTLYGTTVNGGYFGSGTVFAVSTNGLNFTNLHSFTAMNNYTNSDGANPYGTPVLAGNMLYGVTYGGGLYGCGVLFGVGVTGGNTFTNLHTFNGGDGTGPFGGLILLSNMLYGTTYSGGGRNSGTVFAVDTNGVTLTTLHYFDGNDGSFLYPRLALVGNTLYGTASSGGVSTNGVVYSINTDGSGFMDVYSFTVHDPITFENPDGFSPYGELVVTNSTLYGTAYYGGTNDDGTVFSINLPPQLHIALSGTNAILSWTTGVGGYQPQYATNLLSPVTWNTISYSGTQNIVTNPITKTNLYFRLMHP